MAQLLAAWRSNIKGVDTVAFMENVHSKYNKPVWISDIAFHSFSGDNINSSDIYNTKISLTADEQEQADELDSLLTVLSRNIESWFLGVSIDSWNRFPANYTDTARFLSSPYGENIQGKLAETVLKQWYRGQRGWGGMQIIGAPTGSSANPILSASMTVSSIDSGKAGKLYVAALLPDNSIYFRTDAGWIPFNNSTLPPYSSVTLGTHNVPILDGSIDVSGLRGTRILAGYGVDQNDLLTNSKYLVIYTIQ